MIKIRLLTTIVAFTLLAITFTDAQAQSNASNSRYTIASELYSELTEKAMDLFAKMDLDAWAATLSDDVVYVFPDGDQDTRTRLTGKTAVLDWWKNWVKTSGIQSMTLSEFNHFPVDVTAQPKGGALKGIHDIFYFSNKLVYKNGSVSMRMNFVTHFNADKKIDRVITYYDRSKIIEVAGGYALKK
jgi:hypothetical protein